MRVHCLFGHTAIAHLTDLQCSINVTFICTGKLRHLSDLHCDARSAVVASNLKFSEVYPALAIISSLPPVLANINKFFFFFN